MCVFTCIPPYAFSIFTPTPKDVINIHEKKSNDLQIVTLDDIILP